MGVLDLINVLKLRKLIVLWTALVGLAVGVLLAIILPTEYVSTAKVQVDSIQRNSLTGLVEPRVRVAEYLGQQAAVASSRSVALQVFDQLVEDGFIAPSDFEERWRDETGGELVAGNDSRLWAADELLEDLTVEANDISSTIELSFRAEDPSHAARVTNAFASAYMAAVLDQKKRRFARKAEDFSGETQALARGVADAQSDLAAFRETSGILPMGESRLESAEIELAALTERLATARADEAEAKSLTAQAEATPHAELINFPVPHDAIAARLAQERLGLAVAALNRIAERFGPKYPDYVEAAKEKATLEENILEAMRDRADYAASRVAALEKEAAAFKASVASMQTTRETYDLLEEKVRASQETYNLVTTRSLEESLQSRVNSVDLFLLSRATPPANPATPPIWLVVLIGAFAGLALGAAVAVFVELYEGRIRNVDPVRRSFRTGLVFEIDAWRPKRANKTPRFGVAA
jgi:uncharacterized protein involved in exopolysaccharide biosynthesis